MAPWHLANLYISQVCLGCHLFAYLKGIVAKAPSKKPKPRKKRVEFRIDDETYDRALAKAGGNQRILKAMIRGWLKMFGVGEIGPPTDEVIHDQLRRAPGGGRKKQTKKATRKKK